MHHDDEDGGWGDETGSKQVSSNAKEDNFPINDRIPSVTSNAIYSNCCEVNMIPLFAAMPDLKSRSRVGAIVALRVSQLSNITPKQLQVWNITSGYPYIALKVTCVPLPPFFPGRPPREKVHSIPQKTQQTQKPTVLEGLSLTHSQGLARSRAPTKKVTPKTKEHSTERGRSRQ